MSGRKPKLTPLEARKQLLVIESEINRAQMAEDWHALRAEVHNCMTQGKASLSSMISTTALAATGLTLLGKTFSAASNKGGWISKIAGLTKFGASLWFALRQRPH